MCQLRNEIIIIQYANILIQKYTNLFYIPYIAYIAQPIGTLAYCHISTLLY